jgi:ABC-type Na+ efflux pump permease subunit
MKGLPSLPSLPSFRIARHEWRLILKEPRFLLPFLITPLLLVGLQAFAVSFSGAASAAEAVELARSLLLMLAILSPGMAVPLGADSFAGERERNTLEILLCLPIRPRSLFWGKVLGILPIPVLVGWLGQGLLVAVLASRTPLPADFPPDMLKALGLTPAVGLFFCSASTLVSLRAETVRGAAQLGSLAMLFLIAMVLPLSGRILASHAGYAGLVAGLAAGSGLCLALARSRFMRLP